MCSVPLRSSHRTLCRVIQYDNRCFVLLLKYPKTAKGEKYFNGIIEIVLHKL